MSPAPPPRRSAGVHLPVPQSQPSFLRLLLVAGAVSLTLAACGRRGALEPPPDPSAPKAEPAQEGGGLTTSPVGQPRRRDPGFEVPKRDFILDPLL